MTGSMKKLGGTAAAIALAAAVVGGGASAARETSPPIAPDPGPSIKTTFVTPRAPTPDKVARLSTPAVWPKGGLTPVVRSAPAGADVQVSGSVVRVRGKGGRLQLDYSRFRDAHGGDWAARLRLVRLGEKGREPVPGRNDLEAGTVTAQVAAGEAYTLDAGPSGSTGDYKATSLAPSDSWQVSRQTGDFTWSEPIGDAPPVPGDFAPEFALTYASGSVDGRVASTNNQTSWVGEGWNLSTGFIERRYIGCAYDLAPGQLKTGDLCWKTDNATLSLGGRSSQLVKIPDTNKWRPVDDDGSRIERLTDAPNGALGGEHWRVTTPDGTQHYFGRRADSGATWTVPVFGNHQDEPCHQATFATSHCQQAWRWNLDYSVDPNGNSISYYYAPETNSYGLNMGSATATYTRGGVLTRADYGARNGVGPTARIVFETADRCVTGTTCARTEMPDVPWDQNCDTATCPGRVSPTFWSTKRLAKVTTQVGSGTTWTAVDEWTLAHSFPAPGDDSAPALWLDSVTHTGRTGAGGATESTPPIGLVPAPYNNRADTATDGLPPMPKFRISTVRTPAGGEITVVYDRDCDPAALPQPYANSTRCFPVRWTPEGASARDDWFAKYVVARVTEKDLVAEGTTMVTNYEYLGGAGWRYNDDELVAPEHRTWSRYRGYEKVLVTRGDHTDPQVIRSATQYQYFRGLDGRPSPDRHPKVERHRLSRRVGRRLGSARRLPARGAHLQRRGWPRGVEHDRRPLPTPDRRWRRTAPLLPRRHRGLADANRGARRGAQDADRVHIQRRRARPGRQRPWRREHRGR